MRRGGIRALLRKALQVVELVPGALVVLVVRAIKPAVVIRFGPLVSSRIGDLAGSTEVYLCERDAGMHGRGTVDIFYHVLPISNYQLKKMWDRTLRVSRFARGADRMNRWLPGGEAHKVPYRRYQARDINGLLDVTPPHLSFTAEEERLGGGALRRLGIREGASFVCFHARDAAYLDTALPKGAWSYHDYRDSSIHNYILAAEKMVCRGYFAIRMGAVTKDELTSANPMIIDYARGDRTDFLDIFLSAKCRFFICSDAGLVNIPRIFRRPITWVNRTILEHVHTWAANDLFIPKLLWLREERRFMTFLEIFDSGVGRFSATEQYERRGIEVIENTPEEIAAVAVEMDERLRGTWPTTEEDEELQRRFWSVFKRSELHGVIVTRVGTQFLRQHRELLQ